MLIDYFILYSCMFQYKKEFFALRAETQMTLSVLYTDDRR